MCSDLKAKERAHLAAKSVLRVVGRPDQVGVVVVDQWFKPCSYTAKVATPVAEA